MARPPRSKRGSIRGGGWDAIARPVPGDVYAAVLELGLDVKRNNGEEIEMPCPQHFNRVGKEDRHPSFSINAEEGYFNCYSCGYSGPFTLLVKDTLNIEWEDAVAWIRKRGGIERVRRAIGETIDQLADASYSTDIDTTKVINEASLALFTDPPLEALDDRGLSLAAVRHLGVRWDPKRDMWITPIRDADDGHLLGWQEKNARTFRNRPYDVQKSLCVFGLDGWEDGKPGVLVEAPLDAAYIRTHLTANGLSGFGAAVSQRQMRLIHDVTDELIIALDNDRDGHKFSEMLRTTWGDKIRLKFWNYKGCDAKDPGEQTPNELLRSFETAYSGIYARF